MSENQIESSMIPNMPIKIALIIDNEVVDVLHTDSRLAAILLSDPLMIDVSNHVDENNNFNVFPKAIYNPKTKTFKNG